MSARSRGNCSPARSSRVGRRAARHPIHERGNPMAAKKTTAKKTAAKKTAAKKETGDDGGTDKA